MVTGLDTDSIVVHEADLLAFDSVDADARSAFLALCQPEAVEEYPLG